MLLKKWIWYYEIVLSALEKGYEPEGSAFPTNATTIISPQKVSPMLLVCPLAQFVSYVIILSNIVEA